MTWVSILALIVSAIAAGGVIMLLIRRGAPSTNELDLEVRLRELTDRLEGKFSDASRERNEALLHQSERVGKLERDISERVAALHESQKQALQIADDVRGLTRILKTPAQRGALGEFFLENALRNVLSPGLYQMQYTFPGNSLRADAVIKYEDKLIPIDAKFSLDNYNRFVEANTDQERDSFAKLTREDFKKRIDETAKYVRPEDGTFEFALMFVPSEALYYDLIVNQVGALGRERSLIEYAHEKKVVPVSPMVLYAYLQTVLQGVRQIQFAQGAEEIRKNVQELQRHMQVYEEYMRKMGLGIKNAASAYNAATTEYNKINKDVMRITGDTQQILEASETPEEE